MERKCPAGTGKSKASLTGARPPYYLTGLKTTAPEHPGARHPRGKARGDRTWVMMKVRDGICMRAAYRDSIVLWVHRSWRMELFSHVAISFPRHLFSLNSLFSVLIHSQNNVNAPQSIIRRWARALTPPLPQQSIIVKCSKSVLCNWVLYFFL